MAERRVVDSSPLISLGKIAPLEFLTSLAEEVVVSEAVAMEVGRVFDDASAFLAGASVAVRAVSPHPLVAPWGLSPELFAVALELAGESGGES